MGLKSTKISILSFYEVFGDIFVHDPKKRGNLLLGSFSGSDAVGVYCNITGARGFGRKPSLD